MEKELQEAYQKAAKYQANVAYLHGILNLIKEAISAYKGKKLKARIAELIEDGFEHTHLTTAAPDRAEAEYAKAKERFEEQRARVENKLLRRANERKRR